jgi:hypothetical protein
MLDLVKQSLTSQFEASLCMLNDCIEKCPPAQWDAFVAKYPFWQVAYHTLCFVDYYLASGEAAFQFRPDFHPAGSREFDDEYPSRRFERDELRAYVAVCRQKATDTLSTETAESLGAASGFARRACSRLELHVYNLRHLQHHVGQLGATLRRVDPTIDLRWVGHGWK